MAEVRAAPYTVLGWNVSDLNGEIDRLVRRRQLQPLRRHGSGCRGIWTTPDGARIAWLHDPDGNTLSLQA